MDVYYSTLFLLNAQQTCLLYRLFLSLNHYTEHIVADGGKNGFVITHATATQAGTHISLWGKK